MSIEITGVTIAHRKKTAAEWSDSEYVLAGAEWGYETDTGKVKIGDGVTPWGGLDYFCDNAGGVTLKPWTPTIYAPIDLITPVDLAENGLTATLTGSTVSVTGNAETLANALISAAGVLSTTQANNLYFKMGASAGAEGIYGMYVGLVDGSDMSTIDNFVQSGVGIISPATTMTVNSIGNLLSPDFTNYSPALEIPASSSDSEICLSYMPVGGANGFGYVTLYIDGEQEAQHQFTQAVVVDRVIVSTNAAWDVADPSNSAWVECLSNPAYPIDGLPPLLIGSGSTKLDETAYPSNATSNLFEITGTPTPLQWDALGGTVVDGDLVAFDSAGEPFVVDVSGGGGDVTAAGDNVFTGSNTFDQPIRAIGIGKFSGDDFSGVSFQYTENFAGTSIGAIRGSAFTTMTFFANEDGTSAATVLADEVHGLESRAGTFPLAFDIERTYGSKETTLTGNLGWTKSSNDKRVYQEVYHNDIAAPTELASMTKVGDGVYMPSVTNLIYVWCSLPNATNTEDGYFYTVTQV